MSGSASGGMRPVTYQQAPLQLAPETMSPYQTKIGGGSGITIPATQYQVPGTNTKNQAPSMPATSTAGSVVGNSASQIQPIMKQMMALMQQRQQNSGVPPMNSNPGGAFYGNPTQQQVGPPNPTSPSSADSMPGPPTPTTPQQPATDAQSAMGPSSDQLLASQGETSTGAPDMMGSGSGQSPMGMGGSGSALGMGVGSALASIGQAFGNMSKADMNAFQNMPKPDINPQQANYQFNPMIGGGDLA